MESGVRVRRRGASQLNMGLGKNGEQNIRVMSLKEMRKTAETKTD